MELRCNYAIQYDRIYFCKKTFPDYEISVSVKSLNSKGFDLSLKGDKNVVMYLDLDIRKLFQESFERGTFQVVINITYQNLSNVLDVEKLKNHSISNKKT